MKHETRLKLRDIKDTIIILSPVLIAAVILLFFGCIFVLDPVLDNSDCKALLEEKGYDVKEVKSFMVDYSDWYSFTHVGWACEFIRHSWYEREYSEFKAKWGFKK